MISDAKRVLFVLDCGVREAEALRTLRSLTGAQTPEVVGLFIEDEDLYGAARLPGMAEVSLASLETANFNPERIARDLASQAQAARRIFEASARNLQLRHSFRISRGRTVETLVSAALQSDIVVVCRPLRASGLRGRRATGFSALIAEHPKILFVNEPWTTGSRVVAVCADSSAECGESMRTAGAIAGAEGLEFVVATSTSETPEWHGDHLVRMTQITEDSLIDLCEAYDARLLVMRPIAGLDWQKLLVGLLDRLSCSLLLLDGESRYGENP